MVSTWLAGLLTRELGVSGLHIPETILLSWAVLTAIDSRVTLTPTRWISILCTLLSQVAVPAGHKRGKIRGEVDEGAGTCSPHPFRIKTGEFLICSDCPGF